MAQDIALQDGWMPIAAAAQALGVTVRTVNRWMKSRKIPFKTVSGHCYVDISASPGANEDGPVELFATLVDLVKEGDEDRRKLLEACREVMTSTNAALVSENAALRETVKASHEEVREMRVAFDEMLTLEQERQLEGEKFVRVEQRKDHALELALLAISKKLGIDLSEIKTVLGDLHAQQAEETSKAKANGGAS